ncbi:L,D-transpeptidase [Magnetococcales bacterium HHB-1]
MIDPSFLAEIESLFLSAGKSDEPALLALGDLQRLFLIQNRNILSQWPISTGKAGFGEEEGSGKTPAGLHQICGRFGENAPMGARFRGRVPTGEIVTTASPDEDYITTRILWLKGLEPGKNCGGAVDSKKRYIYLHGTPHHHLLGQPVSAGCLRLRDDHMIDLFKKVKIGTLTWIASSRSPVPLTL